MSIEIVLGTPETGGISHEESFIVTDDGTETMTAACPQRWW
jgi:Xaa-Pro aminopeptidase